MGEALVARARSSLVQSVSQKNNGTVVWSGAGPALEHKKDRGRVNRAAAREMSEEINIDALPPIDIGKGISLTPS